MAAKKWSETHGAITSDEVCAAIIALRRTLKARYGADFSFVVAGSGYILAQDSFDEVLYANGSTTYEDEELNAGTINKNPNETA